MHGICAVEKADGEVMIWKQSIYGFFVVKLDNLFNKQLLVVWDDTSVMPL